MKSSIIDLPSCAEISVDAGLGVTSTVKPPASARRGPWERQSQQRRLESIGLHEPGWTSCI